MIIKANANIVILFIFLLILHVGFRYVYFYERVIENQNLLGKLGVFGSFTALPNLREHYYKVSHVGFRYVYFYNASLKIRIFLVSWRAFTALPNLPEHYHKVSRKSEKMSRKSKRFFLDQQR